MLTAERVRELLEYLPDSGLLIWRVKPTRRIASGWIAGSLNKNYGYIEIRIDNQVYRAHRLAWLLMTGEWPKREIDHINLEPADNRWCNLREATRSQQNANRAAYAKSGFKGVFRVGNRWRADFRSKYIGMFGTPEEAHAAYCKKAEEHFGPFFRGR